MREKKIDSVLKAKRMEDSLSNGRKIFRLFLFMQELHVLYDLFESKTIVGTLRILKVISACCSFLYYLTDNIVWLSNLGFTSPYVPFSNKLRWKQIKNFFSLSRTVFEAIVAFRSVQQKKQEEAEISQ